MPTNTPFWNLSLCHLGDVELHISFSFLLCAPIVTNSLPSCLMVTVFKRSYQMLSLIWQAYIYFMPWAINWFVWPFFIHQTQSIPLPWNPSNLNHIQRAHLFTVLWFTQHNDASSLGLTVFFLKDCCILCLRGRCLGRFTISCISKCYPLNPCN